ncbi:Fe-S cluster assembly protein SufD [Acetobacter sp. AN02]|uniref:Fe-S cluster assembly protein SufD n=1 Tax=Acetobacter sp. AN02 TaxID=2894186 RepID=UPI0024343CA2|nr:Fe-S cluster assembly protein SufD [Acetobacter sp. AN02]MDG6094852.1 Fe-S cluster assembly protein SufD [Acetobacter sp. AN02]
MSAPAAFAQQLEKTSGAARDAALALERIGLPGPKTEAFLYTSLRPLTGRSFTAPPEAPSADAVRALIMRSVPVDGPLAGQPLVVFVNGVFSREHSKYPDQAGVHIRTDATDAVQEDGDMPFLLLNDALYRDVTVLEVDRDTDAGSFVVLSLSFGTDTSFHPRLRVRAGDGASVTLTEIAAGEGAYLNNPVLFCDVSPRAHVVHTKLQQEDAQAVHMAAVRVAVAEGGSYDSFTLGLGGVLSRHEVRSVLGGAKAAVHINGAQLLTERQTGDITSVIRHAAPDCISRQTVRNVLGGHARGVFQGKVFVERIAQKTDGYQMNQALLVSETAEMDAKPELEIYADDVKCSHGATVGALDADQLFYLCSRGIPGAEARQILISAFLEEVLDLVTDEAARDALQGVLQQALAKRIGAVS